MIRSHRLVSITRRKGIPDASDPPPRRRAARTMPEYPSEEALVQEFLGCLQSEQSPWGRVKAAAEFYYVTGRTDVVAMDEDGSVIAFEAKLLRWRTALHQAFRNTFFAQKSFVVLPEKIARLAARFVAEFERRNVGLCYIKAGQIHVVHPAKPVQPFNTGLAAKAANLLRSSQWLTALA